MAAVDDDADDFPYGDAAALAVLLPAVYGGVGGLIGAPFKRWRTVYARGSGPTVSLAPFERVDAWGSTLSLRLRVD